MLLLTFSSCEAQKISQSTVTQELQPLPSAGQSEEHPKEIDYVFVEGNSLSYNGYDIVKLSKKAKYNYSSETKSTPDLIDVSYAVLKKDGRTLTTFEGLHYPLGNETNFGVFSFLGGEKKQLIVSQAIPRGGRHWIIDLSRNARIIFDSGDYAVGREWISVIDIDKDGVQEIYLPVTAFYGFHNLSSAETPLTGIIFKYDVRARRYFPANSTFKDYALRGIDVDITGLESKSNEKYLSRRLAILLRYIYAGEEQEAWSFFEREYELTADVWTHL